jgi:DNA repair protein RadA/Sms
VSSPRWAGRCPGCGEWNTLVETTVTPEPAAGAGSSASKGSFGTGAVRDGWPTGAFLSEEPVPLSEVDTAAYAPTPTRVSEVDRVLSGGLVPGSVTLLGGEPGIGKSTLVLQILGSLAASGVRTLLVAAEEAAEQVRRRASRLDAVHDDCFVMATNDLAAALQAAGRLAPELVVVDSIQALCDPSFAGRHGSPTQVRECAQALAHFAKATETAVILVGHVTKDGALAGPRTLEHLVDTVLTFEGDRHHALRCLTATKHRFGAAGELGLFEMSEGGLKPLADPSAILLADRRRGVDGAVVAPVIEGRRPLLVEVQALVSASRATGKRVVQGIPIARLALLLAVLERIGGFGLSLADVFVSTVGGIKVAEPGLDLAVSMAVVSALTGHPVPEGVVMFGEVGLGGEIRQCANPQRRLAEAERLGFATAFAPISTPRSSGRLQVVEIATLAELVERLGLVGDNRTGRPAEDSASPPGRSRKRPSGSAKLSLVRD